MPLTPAYVSLACIMVYKGWYVALAYLPLSPDMPLHLRGSQNASEAEKAMPGGELQTMFQVEGFVQGTFAALIKHHLFTNSQQNQVAMEI